MSYLVMLTKVIHPIWLNRTYLEKIGNWKSWNMVLPQKKNSWMASSTSPKKTLQVISHVRKRVLVVMQVYIIMWFLLRSMRSSTLNIMYKIHKRMGGALLHRLVHSGEKKAMWLMRFLEWEVWFFLRRVLFGKMAPKCCNSFISLCLGVKEKHLAIFDNFSFPGR
jgi:hypothetical protein